MEFEEARLKIKRADYHIRDLQTRLGSLPESHIASTEINAAGGNKVIKYDSPDLPQSLRDIALIVGDVVHNLKCALDYSWLGTIRRVAPQAESKRAKFPVADTVGGLKNLLAIAKIDESCPELVRLMITEIQPYEAGNFAIWPIHKLDIRDKHRLLIPFMHYGSVANIEVKHPSGMTRKGGTWGTQQKFPWYIPVEDGWDVEDKGKLALSVMFHEDVLGREYRPLDMLMLYSHFVVIVVDVLERFLESLGKR
jgi:hypothetical protein